MDWKREAIDKLKCYEVKKSSYERASKEMHRLQDSMTSIHSAVGDSVPVRGGGNRREDALINNIANRTELEWAMKEAKGWVDIVESGLSALDTEERHILDRFFIHRTKGNADRLCEELGVEKTRVYELRNQALRKFTLALYGVTEI